MPTLCYVCGSPAIARQLCKKHYSAFMKYGDPNRRANLRNVPFEKRYQLDEETGCWLWIGGTNSDGYGVWSAHGETKAHRASWVLHHGIIPPGLHVLHRCDRPSCVNPAHLFLGTHQDNMADLRKKGRAYGAIGVQNHGAKLSDAEVLAIIQDFRPAKVIAEEFKISKGMVDKIRNGGAWKHLFLAVWKTERLRRSGRTVLTDAQKLAIYNDTRTQCAIAAQYGVSQSLVSRIKRGL